MLLSLRPQPVLQLTEDPASGIFGDFSRLQPLHMEGCPPSAIFFSRTSGVPLLQDSAVWRGDLMAVPFFTVPGLLQAEAVLLTVVFPAPTMSLAGSSSQ